MLEGRASRFTSCHIPDARATSTARRQHTPAIRAEAGDSQTVGPAVLLILQGCRQRATRWDVPYPRLTHGPVRGVPNGRNDLASVRAELRMAQPVLERQRRTCLPRGFKVPGIQFAPVLVPPNDPRQRPTPV